MATKSYVKTETQQKTRVELVLQKKNDILANFVFIVENGQSNELKGPSQPPPFSMTPKLLI